MSNTVGSIAVVKLLLEHGASPHAACDAGHPMMWAAGSGKVGTLQALLQAGANPNAAANSNVTPAPTASAAGKEGLQICKGCTVLVTEWVSNRMGKEHLRVANGFLLPQSCHMLIVGSLASGRSWERLPCHAAPCTAQHSTAQHSTAQHSTEQHSTTQRSTAQHSTAQHSAAQHSTAQHSAAQHSTTQHSTAQHGTGTAQHGTAPGTVHITCGSCSVYCMGSISARPANICTMLQQQLLCQLLATASCKRQCCLSCNSHKRCVLWTCLGKDQTCSQGRGPGRCIKIAVKKEEPDDGCRDMGPSLNMCSVIYMH